MDSKFLAWLSLPPAPAGWRPLSEAPLLILVGLTGVGKSSTLRELEKIVGWQGRVLPERRALTDLLIIPQVQEEYQLPTGAVRDRAERFKLTRLYRQRYPGGMAHALSRLWLAPQINGWLVFDGLRGSNEVLWAATELPDVRFAYLDAPDYVRVKRLITRNDRFDQISRDVAARPEKRPDQINFPSGIFTAGEQAHLIHLVEQGEVNRSELLSKIEIVKKESENYDATATSAALREAAPARTLFIDTTSYTPAQAAKRLATWLNPG